MTGAVEVGGLEAVNEEQTAHALIFVSAEEAQHWPRGACVLKRRLFTTGDGQAAQRYEVDNYFREDWVMDEAQRFGDSSYALLPDVPTEPTQ